MDDLQVVAGARGGSRGLFESLARGDRLGIRGAVKRALGERCLLWDVEGLAVRVLAVLAHRQLSEGRVRRSAEFVERVLDEAIAGLLFEGAPLEELRALEVEGFDVHGLPVGIGGAAAARACRAHNRMPLEERRAFRGLVVEGRSLDDVARELEVDGGRVARGARRVLMRFLEETVKPEERPGDCPVGRPSVRPEVGVCR